jgi:hypothetical protein
MMKKFLGRTVVFSMAALLLGLALQLLISWKIKDQNLRENDTLQMANVNADMVFIGNSRCWGHFDPRFFEDAFGLESINLGIGGHSEIELAELRLENYLAKNEPPKFVILNLDPFAKSDPKNLRKNFILKKDYARYAFFPNNHDLPILDFFQFNAAEKYLPLYALFKYKTFKDCLFPRNPNLFLQYGYENKYDHWDTIKRPIDKVTGRVVRNYYRAEDLPAIKNALNRLKQTCADKGISLICIQTPVYKSIYDEEIYSRSAAMCKDLHVPFLDLTGTNFRNDISLFYNANHMNRHGVETMNAYLRNNDSVRMLMVKK